MIYKMSLYSMFCILALSLGITNHVILIPNLLQAGNRDAWFGVILGTMMASVWSIILYLVLRNIGQQSLRKWLEAHCSMFVAKAILIGSVLFVFCLQIVTIARFITFIKFTYLLRTPIVMILLLLVSLCAYLAYKGIQAISIAAAALLPVVIIFGIMVSLGNLKIKKYSYLTPLFEHGFGPAGHCAFISLGSLLQLAIVVFLHQHIHVKVSWLAILMMVIFLGGITFGPLIGAIASFGPEIAANMQHPAFEQWRMLSLSKNILHLDFIALFQWISGTLIQISLFLSIISENLASQKMRRPIVIILASVITIGALSIPAVLKFTEWFIVHLYAQTSLWVFFSLTIVLLLLVLVHPKSKGRITP